MLGFFIGTLCLIGLIKVLRGGFRRGRGYGGWSMRSCGGGGFRGRGGCGGGGYDRDQSWDDYRESGFGDRGSSFWLRAVMERLNATPDQAKVIRDAVDEMWRSASDLRDEARATREDVAKAMKSPSLDETILGELFARHDTHLEKMRKDAVGALAKIHVVLDDRQREILAQLIARGPFAGRGGPFRSAWA